MRYRFNIDITKFILSMIMGFILILGVAGFMVIELNNKGGIVSASITKDIGAEDKIEQLSSTQILANKIWGVRQKMWVADNPIIRVGRQIVYLVIFYINTGDNFIEQYKELN